MKKTKGHPKVLLVGRTNVGKSTLFNRLADNAKSIVLEREGVTRDYLHEIINWDGKRFDLIDTGGLCFKKGLNSIHKGIQEKVLNLFEQATLILLVCDVKNGLSDQDKQIAKLAHKSKKPALLLINKIDSQKGYDENFVDFYSLGFKEMISISAIHGIGISELLEKIVQMIPEEYEQTNETPQPEYKVAIIGKPNVGKSSLMNLLMEEERTIISDVAGTTREAISECTYCFENLIQLTDTAGVRRKSKIDDNLETLMVKSSLNAIKNSDIVILMVDASQLQLSHQELRLLFYAVEQKKSILIVFNKTDLLSYEEKQMLKYNLEEYDFILNKVPTLMVSCKNKKNMHKIYPELEKSWQRRNQKFNSIEIDELIKEQLNKKPLYHKRVLLKLLKIKHVPTTIPMFQIHVNFPEWFGQTQLGFIENILRQNYDLKGTPVVFAKRRV